MKRIAILFLFLAGCTSKETVIQDHTVAIAPPVIHDTIMVSHYDSVFVAGEQIVNHDTTVRVEYFPIEKKFYITVKPDTIFYHYTDTVQFTKTEIVTTPLLSKFGLVGIGAVIATVLVIALKFWMKFKL